MSILDWDQPTVWKKFCAIFEGEGEKVEIQSGSVGGWLNETFSRFSEEDGLQSAGEEKGGAA